MSSSVASIITEGHGLYAQLPDLIRKARSLDRKVEVLTKQVSEVAPNAELIASHIFPRERMYAILNRLFTPEMIAGHQNLAIKDELLNVADPEGERIRLLSEAVQVVNQSIEASNLYLNTITEIFQKIFPGQPLPS